MSKEEIQASEIVVIHMWYIITSQIYDIDVENNAIIAKISKSEEIHPGEVGVMGAHNLFCVKNMVRAVILHFHNPQLHHSKDRSSCSIWIRH